MARPPKEGIDYFPHDCDASHDEKIESLCAIYGHHIGYSVIFRLYERIYRAGGKLIVSDAETLQILARNVAQMEVKDFIKILNSCLRLGLFDQKLFKASKIISSNGIIKRMEPIISKRVKMKEIYQKSNKNELVSGGISEAETQQKPDKVKESKVKESKGKNIIKDNQSNLDQILATMDLDIKNFRETGMADEWIKISYLGLGVSESQIDRALGKEF